MGSDAGLIEMIAKESVFLFLFFIIDVMTSPLDFYEI